MHLKIIIYSISFHLFFFFLQVIEKVSMVGVAIFYKFDDIWSCLSNVHTLELQHTKITDRSVMLISDYCFQLKSLNLFCCLKVTDVGLTYLSQKKLPLKSLNVERTSVSFKAVASVLKNIPSIEELWFDNVPKAIFEATGLNDTLEEISNGVTFNLKNIVILNNPLRPKSHLTSLLEVCRVVCPLITDLTVTEITTAEQLHLCSLFEELKIANLQCSTTISHELCINYFLTVRGDKINTLTLMTFSLSLDVLVKSCPNLEHLTLEYPSFENIPASDIDKKFSLLKTFNLLNDVMVTEENIKSIVYIISSSPLLQELSFQLCNFSERITEILLKYPKNLKVLSFSNTPIEASFLKEILSVHDNLIELRIDNSGITCDEYDDLMDIVDNMERKIHVVWADYSAAIKALYDADENIILRNMKRQIMKL